MQEEGYNMKTCMLCKGRENCTGISVTIIDRDWNRTQATMFCYQKEKTKDVAESKPIIPADITKIKVCVVTADNEILDVIDYDDEVSEDCP